MTLTERFLKAKHWQLFLLIMGIPIIFQFALFSSIGNGTGAILSAFSLFPVMMILFIATFFGWFWSIAIGLRNKIPANIKMKTGLFKVFLFIPIAYMLFILLAIGMSGTFSADNDPNPGLIASSIGLIIPLHLFSMFCIFYCLYFVSKTIKTVELQREVTFSDFAGEFFLIWFYPIGIWIVQPKINKLASDTTEKIGSTGEG